VDTDRTFSVFINSLNAEETKTKYELCLKDFMNFVKVKRPSNLLKIEIEKNIIDYVLDFRKKVSWNTLNTRLCTVYPKRTSPAGKKASARRNRERTRQHHKDKEIDALMRIYGDRVTVLQDTDP
jgi:hypothetical protein